MRLRYARVQNYRSIHDTGWFEVERLKTLLVGPNEAGKTAVLKALQTLNMPSGSPLEIKLLRDFPRSRYTDVEAASPKSLPIATGVFELSAEEVATVLEEAPDLKGVTYYQRSSSYGSGITYDFLDDNRQSMKTTAKFGEVEADLQMFKAHLLRNESTKPLAAELTALTEKWNENTRLWFEQDGKQGTLLDAWLEECVIALTPEEQQFADIHERVRTKVREDRRSKAARSALRVPTFVYYSNYYRVRPRIHLERLALQIETDDIDIDIDYGNVSLLKFLRLDARELSELGKGMPTVQDIPGQGKVAPTSEEVSEFEDKLDDRTYKLNSASIKLTKAVNEVWGEDRALLIEADGQYLRVFVRNDDDAKVEIDQGSEGYQWLVSFFIVFEAQTQGQFEDTILLLDEPGVSLHALKQRQFQETVSKISAKSQTIFTTHSPFMIGTSELDLVRVVDLVDRDTGTKVHEDFAVGDPRSLFPLQAHIGYELGQTIFGHKRNVILEGITDYWYLDAVAAAARDAGETALDEAVSLVPAGDAGKVVYHAKIISAQGLKVAALFDSDDAGERGASDEILAHLFKDKQILRVADFYEGDVKGPEFEDLIRDTLVTVAKEELGVDASEQASEHPARPIVDVLTEAGADSKYRLGKAFIRWMRTNGWSDMEAHEQSALTKLFVAINKGTK